MSLYLILLILSILFPIVLSFDKKVGFYKHWLVLLPSLLLTGALFIVFDIYFARRGIWGFNPQYHSGIVLADLPLEEWLFFFVIPYASIFIHYVLTAYFPDAVLPSGVTRIISFALMAILLLAVILYPGRVYSAVYFSLMIIVLFITSFERTKLLNRFFISFPVILVPFIIINGILTGSFIEGEVVWYNEAEISGLRLITIPVEDFAYGFSLILINLLLMNYFRKLFSKNQGS